MSELNESKVLKDLGLNQKNTWVIYDKAPKQFFEFLSTNFDDRNILSEVELQKTKELQESGEWLDEEAVNEELRLIREKYPEIDDLSDEKVKELEDELDFYSNLLNEREKRCEKIQQEIADVDQQIESNEKEEIDLIHHEKCLKESCSSSITKLDQCIHENQTRVSSINEVYSQPVS